MDEEVAAIADYLDDMEEEVDVNELLQGEIGTNLTAVSHQPSQLVGVWGLTPLDPNETDKLFSDRVHEADQKYVERSHEAETSAPEAKKDNNVCDHNPNLGKQVKKHLENDFPTLKQVSNNLVWEHGQKIFCRKCGGEIDVWKPLAAHWYICNGDGNSEQRKTEIINIAKTHGKSIEEKDILLSFEEFGRWYRDKLHTQFLQGQDLHNKHLSTPSPRGEASLDYAQKPIGILTTEKKTPMPFPHNNGHAAAVLPAVSPFESVNVATAVPWSAAPTKSNDKASIVTPFPPALDEIMAVGMATGFATLAGISDYFSKMHAGGVDWRQLALDGAVAKNASATFVSTTPRTVGVVNATNKPNKKLTFKDKFDNRKKGPHVGKGHLKNPYKAPTPAQLYHRKKMEEERQKRCEYARKIKQEAFSQHVRFLKQQEEEKLRNLKMKEEERLKKEKEFKESTRHFVTQRD